MPFDSQYIACFLLLKWSLVCGAANSGFEPGCSKYDFEEKLFAKTIRLDSTLGDLVKRVTALEEASLSNGNITETSLFKYTESFTTKNEKNQIKSSDIFHISAQNIDCGYSLEPPRRGGCNEYPQSMFLSRNRKNNVYPCKPQVYYIKVGFKGVKII